MSLHQLFLKDGDDLAIVIEAGPCVSDPAGLIGGYVRAFRVVFSPNKVMELIPLQEPRALSNFEFDGLNDRLKKKSAGPAADYVKKLKTLPLDVLHAARANTSMTDMWKFNMISDEIESRMNQ